MSRILKLSFVVCLLLTLFCGAGAVHATSALLKCGSWQVVPSPNPGSNGNQLFGVKAITANNVWAVGYDYIAQNNGQDTLIEHWDGSQWTVVPSPNRPSLDNDLFDVAPVSASDIWAVGSSVDSHGALQTLTEHWDGTQWRIIPSPGKAELDAVAAVSTDDVWALGDTVIIHWDGTQWNIVQAPYYGNLLGLSVVSANDIWAVGGSNNATLIEHWDGTQWTRVQSPNPAGDSIGLWGVTAIATNDVWVVGSYEETDTLGEHFSLPLTEHWNGTSWSIVSAPRGKAYYNQLFGVSATSTNTMWAVGYQIIEHWNGTSWRAVPGANGSLNDVMAVAGTSQVWAVGSTSGNAGTLIEYYC